MTAATAVTTCSRVTAGVTATLAGCRLRLGL